MEVEGCSSCGASGSALARCGRCRWPRYCSKSCQRSHWSARHRRQCVALAACGKFRDLERRFWTAERASRLEDGLKPDSMRFYGEVLFLVLGLKACVMLSNLPPQLRSSFVAEVVAPSGLLGLKIQLFVVADRVLTPAEYELSGDLVIANESHALFQDAVSALRLQSLLADTDAAIEQRVAQQLALTDANTAGSHARFVGEEALATVLDYPVALSDCREPMVEVGYFLRADQSPPSNEELLTSYCASSVSSHRERIQTHFERYRTEALSSAGVVLVVRSTSL